MSNRRRTGWIVFAGLVLLVGAVLWSANGLAPSIGMSDQVPLTTAATPSEIEHRREPASRQDADRSALAQSTLALASSADMESPFAVARRDLYAARSAIAVLDAADRLHHRDLDRQMVLMMLAPICTFGNDFDVDFAQFAQANALPQTGLAMLNYRHWYDVRREFCGSVTADIVTQKLIESRAAMSLLSDPDLASGVELIEAVARTRTAELRDGSDELNVEDALWRVFATTKSPELAAEVIRIRAGSLRGPFSRHPQLTALAQGGNEESLTDLARSQVAAARIVSCRLAGGCGPNSLGVLELCRRSVCPPGADLQIALADSHSPAELRAMNAIADILMQYRNAAQQPNKSKSGRGPR